MRRRRGSTLIESALAFSSFAILLAGIMELGFAGFASDAVTFAAQRAARFASVRGSASGHAATTADIQSTARQYAAPLAPASLTVNVSWSPNNNPGSTVTVTVSCSIRPSLLPLSAVPLNLQSRAAALIIQ